MINDQITANYVAFIHECHAVFKKAQKILIREMLALEELISELDVKTPDGKQADSRYRHWLELLELTYDSFVWIASNHDRSNVTKVYKGPKHGRLANQNIGSVIELADELNDDPNVFAFPLDFSRFSCVGDLLRLHRHADGRATLDFVEVKEGEVNEEILNVIKAHDPVVYSGFVESYGDKGVEQLDRVVRQQKTAEKNLKHDHSPPGIYQDEEIPRVISEMKIGPGGRFDAAIEYVVRSAELDEYSIEIIDECLLVTALDARSEEKYRRKDFVARSVVQASFLGHPSAESGGQDALFNSLRSIEFNDWREGFGYPSFDPPALRRLLSTRSLLNLMFGRIHLLFYFDLPLFVRLCAEAGIQAGFIRRKATNRIRTTHRWKNGQYPLHKERAIGYITGGLRGVFGPAYLHEILFNWKTPKVIINHIRQLGAEVPRSDADAEEDGVKQNWFSESDLESA